LTRRLILIISLFFKLLFLRLFTWPIFINSVIFTIFHIWISIKLFPLVISYWFAEEQYSFILIFSANLRPINILSVILWDFVKSYDTFANFAILMTVLLWILLILHFNSCINSPLATFKLTTLSVFNKSVYRVISFILLSFIKSFHQETGPISKFPLPEKDTQFINYPP